MNRKRKSNIVFKTYKDGKDQGIDFRYSTPSSNNAIIGQAKHYYRSGYNAMMRVIKKEEAPKIAKLNPGRYIFATSVDLSPANENELKEILYPYIKDLADVYGMKDLNRLLEEHPEVLGKHYKLWYNSTNVLRKILHYAIEGRSNEFKEKDLKRKIRLYVPTISLEQARQALEKNRFVIITGEPGAGKTTTAELLLYQLIGEGYELTYIYDNVSEIESKISNDDSKQVFYFDDFLGHNSVEMRQS